MSTLTFDYKGHLKKLLTRERGGKSIFEGVLEALMDLIRS